MNSNVMDFGSYKKKCPRQHLKETPKHLSNDAYEAMRIDYDARKAFVALLKDAKIKSEQNKIPYIQLLDEETKNFINGIYVKKIDQPIVVHILNEHKITNYTITNNKFRFICYEDYKTVREIVEILGN